MNDRTGMVAVHRIEPNGDLTVTAYIWEGKRFGYPKEKQLTYKKIK